MGKVSKFGKIFTIVFNIVFIALIIYVSFLSLKFIFWSFLSIFSFSSSDSFASMNRLINNILMMFIVTMVLLIVLSYAFSAVCLWGIFKKTGTKCSNALIPIYNNFCLIKDIMGSGWYFILSIIPFVNTIFSLFLFYKLGKCFGKTTTYCVLMMFFPTIVMPLLAYDDSEYEAYFAKKKSEKNENEKIN